METDGHLVVVLNLAPQDGETEGYAAADHLAVLLDHAPDLPARHRPGRPVRDRRRHRPSSTSSPPSAAPGSSSPTSPATTAPRVTTR